MHVCALATNLHPSIIIIIIIIIISRVDGASLAVSSRPCPTHFHSVLDSFIIS